MYRFRSESNVKRRARAVSAGERRAFKVSRSSTLTSVCTIQTSTDSRIEPMAKGLKRHQRNNWLRVLRRRLRPWGIRQAQAPTISAARDVRYSTFETNLKREHHGPLRLKPFLLAAQERTFHVLIKADIPCANYIQLFQLDSCRRSVYTFKSGSAEAFTLRLFLLKGFVPTAYAFSSLAGCF